MEDNEKLKLGQQDLLAQTKKVEKEQIKGIPMGLGVLGTSEVVFSRQFRWCLEADRLPSWNVQKLRIDHHTHKLHITLIDFISGGKGLDALRWVNGLYTNGVDEKLKFTTYDGCGSELYSIIFSDLAIENHNTAFDYESSELTAREVTVNYAKHDYIYKFPGTNPVESDAQLWFIQVIDPVNNEVIVAECPVKLEKRPTIRIEETKINFLNAAVTLPGKARWETLPVKIDTSHIANLPKLLHSYGQHSNRLRVNLTLKKGAETLEAWCLNNSWFKMVKFAKELAEMTIQFSDLEYHPYKGE